MQPDGTIANVPIAKLDRMQIRQLAQMLVRHGIDQRLERPQPQVLQPQCTLELWCTFGSSTSVFSRCRCPPCKSPGHAG